jgi:hypothetical protein
LFILKFLLHQHRLRHKSPPGKVGYIIKTIQRINIQIPPALTVQSYIIISNK